MILPDLTSITPSGVNLFGFRKSNCFAEWGRQLCIQPPTWRTRSLCLCPCCRVAKLYRQAPGSLFVAFYKSQGYAAEVLTYVYGSWPIITGSGLDDWIYWRLLLQSLLITINYSAIANLPTSQITRIRSILVLVLYSVVLLVLFCILLYSNSPQLLTSTLL
jgi:hypothetical protein